MKKIFLLLTAITTVGFAGNTLKVETGINGDPRSKEAKAPISLALEHSQDDFEASVKLSNEAILKFDSKANEFDWKNTKLEASAKYKTPKLSKTTWDFEVKGNSKLKENTVGLEANTGLSHDFGKVVLGESLSYKYDGNNELTGKVTLDVLALENFKLISYVESGYDFKDEKVLLNAKIGGEYKHDLFTYKPFFETKNKFAKDLTFNESKNTFEVGAFSLKVKGVDVDTSLKFNVNLDSAKEVTADLDSSVKAKYKYVLNDKVSFTPSAKLGFGLTFTKNPTITLKPEVKLSVDQKVNDKLSLGYEFVAKAGAVTFEYNTSAYKTSVNDLNLGATLKVNYNF